MQTVYIGIGSNLGNRKENIDRAVSALKRKVGIQVVKVSSVYETDPVGGPEQGRYLNGAIEIKTDLEPYYLLRVLNDIEDGLGRIRFEKNGPRTIDLDLLIYGDKQIETDKLTVPHPRMKGREFVLRGLNEIAPQLEI